MRNEQSRMRLGRIRAERMARCAVTVSPQQALPLLRRRGARILHRPEAISSTARFLIGAVSEMASAGEKETLFFAARRCLLPFSCVKQGTREHQ